MKPKPKTDPGFRLEAKGDDVELDIYDVIGSGWFGGVSAKAVVDALKPHKNAKSITVNLNSPGGDAFDGISIYNVLTRHKAPVTVNIDGLAASAASVIAMAGDEINMAENAMLMIHNAWGISLGGGDDMRHTADMLDKLDGQIKATYASRTGGDPDTIKDQMNDETWFTAEEALADGFATSVTPAKKAAAHFRPEIFSQFKHAPDELRAAFSTSPADPTADNPEHEDNNMANDITPDAFAAANPEAVKNWKAEGGVESRNDELARIAALAAAFPKDPAFALEQAGKGHDVAKAKAEYADVLIARNDALTAENAELKTRSDAGDGADPVVLVSHEKPGDKYAELSADERIQAEWDDNHDGCRDKFKVISAYAGYRKARLPK